MILCSMLKPIILIDCPEDCKCEILKTEWTDLMKFKWQLPINKHPHSGEEIGATYIVQGTVEIRFGLAEGICLPKDKTIILDPVMEELEDDDSEKEKDVKKE